MWYLAEYENGKVKMNVVPKNLKPVEEYLFKQKRFRHLTAENIQLIQEHRDRGWKLIRERWLKEWVMKDNKWDSTGQSSPDQL